MNRRGFLSAMLKAAAGCAILPSAVTYARQWKPVASGLIVPVANDIGCLNTELLLMRNLDFLRTTCRNLFGEEETVNVLALPEWNTEIMTRFRDLNPPLVLVSQ